MLIALQNILFCLLFISLVKCAARNNAVSYTHLDVYKRQLLTYGFQLYYAIRINVGAFTGTDMAKASILSTSTASLYLDAVRNILVVLVYMGVAFLVGKNYLEKKRLAAWLTPIIVYVFIRFTDVILNTYAPALVAKIVYMVVLAFVAAVSVWMVRNWYQSEKQAKKQF